MNNLEKLKQKNLEFIIKSDEYSSILEEVSSDIVKACKSAENEATVVSIFELELFAFIKNVLGITYYPQKEKSVHTERHISKGRIDSKIGALVIEFKQPSTFNNVGKKNKASKQLKEYLNGLFKEEETDYLGLVTDGVECQFISMEDGQVVTGAFEPIKAKHLDRLIKNIILLEKVALTPQNLVKDFCSPAEESVAKQLTLVLYNTLKTLSTGKSKMLFQEWKELFRLAHDDKSKQKAIEERRSALEAIVNEKFKSKDDEYLTLYALQTTYAIIVKIIAYKVISKVRFDESLIEFNKLALSDSNSLRHQMNELEEGAVFRNLGIGNLLEGDFFAWYSTPEQWNSDIGNLVGEIFQILTPYEDKAIFDDVINVFDLFKDLYMNIIPDKVRHSLGEFYTPPWLADHLIQEAINKSNNSKWTALDPCAGSGTFLTTMIRKVLEETTHLSREERLKSILSRVKGIDLNPLAVLTARINYFINISPLILDGDEFEIPVYLGDASYVPSQTLVEGVDCLYYKIQTIKGGIEIILPKSIVDNPEEFSKIMTSIEDDIHNLDEENIVTKLLSITSPKDQQKVVIENIKLLASQFIELEKNDWNGIWARIVTNFLTTANLGRFDIIAGNPPWIDWKNLPAGYRERIKSLCVSRHLFSGDSITGGINLNVCALISNVCAENWLKPDGNLAFLMPQSLLFQQTYEGFRKFNLDNERKLYLQEIYDWTKAGHPFKPVQHKFLSFFFSAKEVDYSEGIPATHYIKNSRENLLKYVNVTQFSKVSHLFKKEIGLIGHANEDNTIFSYADSSLELNNFKKISGSTSYVGREGVEFYPQELFLLEYDSKMKPQKDKVFVKNFQKKSSKYKIPQQTILLEKKFLHPLVKGVDIERFHIKKPKYLVPFPYNENNKRSPIGIKELTKESKLLAKYFTKFKEVLTSQTDYNSKIIGSKHNNEFYALARVGDYSFAKNYVAFRDNSKWQAAVVTDLITPWGELKRPQFQNHAVTITQDENGRFITLDEAHYICAIFNAPVTARFIYNSSDSRTFKIRPQLNIPSFDNKNIIHKKLMETSKLAHKHHSDKSKMLELDERLNELVSKI
ncbi:Eco57I restriction-modification methylase domain-containing protein [Salinimicrobium terrae]|uniref:Eco57I restriction-modification methylase domain-containing protein n=1 Tax=Salinimicrobium terrae TaxID=470866 RepID=UPI00040C2EB7|nr:N-6 DNA methylase [Salinimicrobium terrae]